MKVRAIRGHGEELVIDKIYDVVGEREDDWSIAIESESGTVMWFNNPYKTYSSYLQKVESKDDLFREQLLNA